MYKNIALILKTLILCVQTEWETIYHPNHQTFCSNTNQEMVLFRLLPPHSQLSISLQFAQKYRLIADIELICRDGNGHSNCQDGTSSYNSCICSQQIVDHQQSSLTLIFRIDQYIYDCNIEIYLEILRCPLGCVYCQGSQAECILYWFNFAKFWQENMDSDGWIVDNNKKLEHSYHYNIQLVGDLYQNQKLEKLFQNMPPHFQIQVLFKLWTFTYAFHSLFVDYIINLDQAQYKLTQTLEYYPDVKIQSIDIQKAHSSTELKLTIQSSSKDFFDWALNTFNLYIAKCIIYCQKCVGPSIQDCTVCIDGWIKYKGACMPSPLILSQMMIKLKPKKDVYNLGQNKVEIEQQFGNITFTIQANCFQKEEVESTFKSCYQCQIQQQYKFTHNCKNKLNFITYQVIYSQEVQSQKYLIINLEDNLCEIYQVISAYDQTFEILILKITKRNS